MHRHLIREFGGAHGVRDLGLLESAVFRPQIGYYNNLLEEAAALMESLALNHAFVDGNKRITFAAGDTFLRANGFFIEVEAVSAHRFITESIANGSFRFREICRWIEGNIKRLRG